MSSGLASDAKERVRQAIDIVDLVGDYLQLRREGRGYKALCPWHDDTKPSLQVNPERQTFRCWVCNIGGDAFSFVMQHDKVTFPEALQMLADRAGIPLTNSDGRGQDEKRLLYQAMAWAEEQFHACLLSPEGEAARDYLDGRGIQPENWRKYHLGYSPDRWDWLLERAQGTRFGPKVLETVGLVGQRRSGQGYYDRFKGRVLFSIRDPQGRPVGVGGRVLPGSTDVQAAKYVNSPETPLFSKSNLLYGLDHAKDTLAKSRTALVMEGYTDCLIAQQHGFGNALAVLGTALGERHIKLLRRFVDRIVLVLDGDEAGRRRTDQILELFVAEQMDLRILTLPDELDPCDFLLQRGAPAFAALVERAVEALDHEFDRQMASITAGSGTHETNAAVEGVLAKLAKAPRLQATTTSAMRLKEDQILNRLALRSGLKESRLRERLTELRRSSTKATAAKSASSSALQPSSGQEVGKLVLAEKWLLQILLQAPNCLDEIHREITPEQFRCPRRREIFLRACALAEAGVSPTFERLMLEFDDLEMKNLVGELDDNERRSVPRSDLQKDLRDLLKAFREAVPQPRNELDLDALRNLVEREKSRQGISRPTDG